MRYLIVFLFSILLFTACQQAEQKQTASADAERYPLKGKVVSVDKANKKAEIDHEEIPGYMEAMTMNFPIREDWVWENLQPGAEIRAELVVDKDGYWLEKIGIVAAGNSNVANPAAEEKFASVGKQVPDFSLTNQDGKKISLKDFEGKALAVTFIYARCPLPDFCIAMSKNFSDLANELQNSDLKDKIRLLTVSFDPENDTPEKLKQYGIGYLGKGSSATDFKTWQLAVGSDKEVQQIADFFGLRYEVDPNDKTQFRHSLRTAVITPDGKVAKILPGSDWTANDLKNELKKSMPQ